MNDLIFQSNIAPRNGNSPDGREPKGRAARTTVYGHRSGAGCLQAGPAEQPASGHVQLIVEAFPQPVQRQTAEEQVQSVLIRIEQGAGQFGQKAQDSGHEIRKQGAQAVRMKDQYAAVEVVRRVQAFFHYCPPAPSAV